MTYYHSELNPSYAADGKCTKSRLDTYWVPMYDNGLEANEAHHHRERSFDYGSCGQDPQAAELPSSAEVSLEEPLSLSSSASLR
jgi:hypothetical protein